MKAGFYISKLYRNVKNPYLVVHKSATDDVVIAQLKVSEDEFLELLGNALNIKFVNEGEVKP